jgi:competence protein ComEA
VEASVAASTAAVPVRRAQLPVQRRGATGGLPSVVVMARGDDGDVGARRLSRLWGPDPVPAEDAPAHDAPLPGGVPLGWVDGEASSGSDRPVRGRHVASGRSARSGPAATAPATTWRLSGVPSGLAAGLLVVAVVVVVAVLVRGAGGGQEVLVGAAAAPGAGPSTVAVSAGAATGDALVTVTTPAAPAPAGPASGAAAVRPEGPVVVHVDGAVHHPGVVTLATGGRVADAVAAAGGTTDEADTSLVNLARPVVDGELVVVPRLGEEVAVDPGGAAAVADGGPGPGGADPAALLDLNTADTTALDGLPGIGPVLAERIVSHRDQAGPFASVEDLGDVSGIGPAVLEDIRDLVTV